MPAWCLAAACPKSFACGSSSSQHVDQDRVGSCFAGNSSALQAPAALSRQQKCWSAVSMKLPAADATFNYSKKDVEEVSQFNDAQ